jgi:hypothetical protein
MAAGGQHHAPAALPPRKRSRANCVEEAGWSSGIVWTSVENLFTGPRTLNVRLEANRSTDCPSPHKVALEMSSAEWELHVEFVLQIL